MNILLSIISGSCGLYIANALACAFNITLSKTTIKKFADQEINAVVNDKVGDCTLLVQAITPPTNDNLIELIFLSDAARRAGAKKVIGIIPYLGYARQAKSYADFECVSSAVVAKILHTHLDEVVIVDAHHIENAKNNHINTTDFFCDYLKGRKNICLVAPDNGIAKKVEKMSAILGVNYALMKKIRTSNNDCVVNIYQGTVQNKECVIIDDIIDSANTICRAQECLLKLGAKNAEVIATHGVFSKGAFERIKKFNIAKITITNSIPHNVLPNNFEVLDISNLIKGHIDRFF